MVTKYTGECNISVVRKYTGNCNISVTIKYREYVLTDLRGFVHLLHFPYVVSNISSPAIKSIVVSFLYKYWNVYLVKRIF